MIPTLVLMYINRAYVGANKKQAVPTLGPRVCKRDLPTLGYLEPRG